MHQSDFVKHTYSWVVGKCIEWNWQMKQFSDTNSSEFFAFVNRTHTIVYRYLKKQQVLDGSCSDLECSMAHEAQQVFAVPRAC